MILKELEGKKIDYLESPNRSSLKEAPKFIIVHYTASTLSAHEIAKYFSNPSAKVSAHFVIGENGEIVQCVPLNEAAWHAGKSSWFEYDGLNAYSIGIEVCNPGVLSKIETKPFTYLTWNKKEITSKDIFGAKHPVTEQFAYWKPFTSKQLESLILLGKYLTARFDILDVLGHDMISPFRKVDPGPCVDPKVYEIMLNKKSDAKTVYPFEGRKIEVQTLYGEPNEHAVIGRNETVKVIDRMGYWFRVQTSYGVAYTKIGKISKW